MKRHFYILFLFFNSILCFAQSGIKVNLVNVPKRITPGSYFNLIFDVESATTFKEQMTVSLKVPDSWEILSQNVPKAIIGQKKIKYIFSVSTSSFAPPGNITSRILINTVSGYRIDKPFQIQVLTVRNIIISPISLPESAKEGDTLKVEYLVENRGNIKDNLKIEVLNGKIDGKIDGKTDINGLNPDESTKFSTKFLIPEGETNSFKFAFGIKAILKDSLKPINFTNSILVYSKKIKKTELYNRFPISVGFWAGLYFIDKKPVYSIQANISGGGYLDKNKRHFLDFGLRGPNNLNNIYFNNFSIYNLRYSYNKNKLISTFEVGDYGLQFAQLTENSRFGRGVNFDIKYDKIGIYGFFIKPRFFEDQKQTFGGRLYFLPNPKLRLSIDYSSKYLKIKRYVWVNLVGASAKYKTEKVNIESEIFGSMYRKIYDFAVSTRFDLSIIKIGFGGNYLYAGKEFYGYFRNSYLLSNYFSVNINSKINLGASAFITQLNPTRDLINFNVSPFSTNYQVNSSYRINQKSSVDLGYTWQKTEDKMEPKRFFYQQDYVALGYNLTGKKIIIRYQGRFGRGKNLLFLEDPYTIKQNISNILQPEVRILPWAWAGLYAQHIRTSRFSAQNKLTDYIYYGASLRLPINKKLNAYFNYRSDYPLDELTQTQSLLFATVNLNLKKHSFELTGGKNIIPSVSPSALNNLYFLLRYTYRLNAPISRLKNLGNIQGQIAVSSDGLKSEGIVMTLGDKKFVSDKDGKFYFKHLVPDKYYLDIDKMSLPKGVVTNLKLPIEVDLKGDSTKIITFTLIKTGTIVGKVLFANIENDEGKGKPSVLIKVSNDTETLTTRVNKDDEFSCKQVKPGKWFITASIIGGNPEDYTITDATQSIEVEADGRVEVEFTIENYKRTIEFNTNTFNLIDKKETKENNKTTLSKTAPKNPSTTPKSKSIIKNVKQTKKITQKQILKKKSNYRLINN